MYFIFEQVVAGIFHPSGSKLGFPWKSLLAASVLSISLSRVRKHYLGQFIHDITILTMKLLQNSAEVIVARRGVVDLSIATNSTN